MSERHTPGPWWTDAVFSHEEMGCSIIAASTDSGPPPGNPTRGQVAFATAILDEDARRCEANARLIAAAPELLESLKWMVENDETNEGDEPIPEYGDKSWNEINAYWIEGINRARAAIAKAEPKPC